MRLLAAIKPLSAKDRMLEVAGSNLGAVLRDFKLRIANETHTLENCVISIYHA